PAEVAAVARHRQRTAVAVNVVRALESADPAHGSCSVGSKQGAGVPGQARWDWAVATATSRRCAWPGEDVVMRAGKLARPAARPDSGPGLAAVAAVPGACTGVSCDAIAGASRAGPSAGRFGLRRRGGGLA